MSVIGIFLYQYLLTIGIDLPVELQITPESNKSWTEVTGYTSSTKTGNGSRKGTKHEVYLKRLKSFNYFDNDSQLDWDEFQSEKYAFQPFTPREMSPNFRAIASESKPELNSKNGYYTKDKKYKLRVKRHAVEVPEFKLAEKSQNLTKVGSWRGSKTRNQHPLIDHWKTGPMNPSLFKVKVNTQADIFQTPRTIDDSSVQLFSDYPDVMKQKIGPKCIPKIKKSGSTLKLSQPFSDFINAAQRNKESSMMFKKLLKKNMNSKKKFERVSKNNIIQQQLERIENQVNEEVGLIYII